MMGPQPQIITAPYSAPPPTPPAPPPQPSANDAMVPVLMAETRQQQGEIRMSIGKLSDKIDELSNKVSLLDHRCYDIISFLNLSSSKSDESFIRKLLFLSNAFFYRSGINSSPMIWETTCMKLLFVSQSVSCSYSFSSFEISRLALQHCDAWNINIKMFWFYLEHHIVKWNVHNLHPLSRTFEWTVSTLLLRIIFKLRSIEVFTWLNTATRN